ncbi:MAG: orotate phosphoribosyltransferase [SAR324 cluster bacterium]|nr:orotate phosphoribosyltransferase [SAR324 cluster bacterium]
MNTLQTNLGQEFLKFAVECQAFKFGDFTLKDGSNSDVFFDSSSFNSGKKLRKLSRFLAKAIQLEIPECNLIYGSAYKGIPLACVVSVELAELRGKDVGYLFDRKEVKKHGDGGSFVGTVPTSQDVIVFVDDVITSASTKINGMEKVLKAFDVKFEAIIVGVDRRSPSGLAVKNVPVYSLTTLHEARDFHSSITGARL